MSSSVTEQPITSSSLRRVQIRRDTLETRIAIALCLDGRGSARLASGVPFLDHMLEQFARHGMLDLEVDCQGDVYIDDHHSVEDIGITLGQACREALGDRRGIVRFGHAYVPLDESLSRVVLDFSGRPGLHYRVAFPRARIGNFDVDLLREFFQGFVNHGQATLHIDNLVGENAHHIAESIFKAFARAFRMAVSRDPQSSDILPSTKGLL